MPQDSERELVGRTPRYEFRSAGKLCTTCGVIVGNIRGDDQIHEQWHQAIAVLLGSGDSGRHLG
jgi:hypothetical protein